MTSCIICGTEHDRLWLDREPAMYCARCARIRQDAKGTVSHVLDSLYLGDLNAAARFDGVRLCVHEDPRYAVHSLWHVPILTTPPRSAFDRSGAVASIDRLDRVALVIGKHLDVNQPLLVHCFGGVERSPLAIAWYLLKTERANTLQAAYDFLRARRPVVADRAAWLADSSQLE